MASVAPFPALIPIDTTGGRASAQFHNWLEEIRRAVSEGAVPERTQYFSGYIDNWETTGSRAGVVEAMSVLNNSGSGVTLDIWLHPAGVSPTDQHKVYDATIGANARVSGTEASPQFGLEGHVIPAGWQVSMQAGTANVLSAVITGRK